MERGRAFKYEFITGTTTRADEEGSEGARTPGGTPREYKRQVMRVSPDGGSSEYSRVSPPQQHHAGYLQQQIARVSPPQQYHQLPPASKFSPPQDHAPSYVSPPLQRAHKVPPQTQTHTHAHTLARQPQHQQLWTLPSRPPPIHDPKRIPVQKSLRQPLNFKPPAPVSVPVPALTSASTAGTARATPTTSPPNPHMNTHLISKPKSAPLNYSPHTKPAPQSKDVQGYYKSTYYNSPSSYSSGPEFSRLPKMFNNKPIFTKPPPNGRKLLGSRSAPNSGRKYNKDVEVGPPYSSR